MLRANASLEFKRWELLDDGLRLHFLCADPGPGEWSDYAVTVTDAELSATANLAQLRTLVTNKLERRYRASAIAARLNPLLGQSVTI